MSDRGSWGVRGDGLTLDRRERRLHCLRAVEPVLGNSVARPEHRQARAGHRSAPVPQTGQAHEQRLVFSVPVATELFDAQVGASMQQQHDLDHEISLRRP